MDPFADTIELDSLLIRAPGNPVVWRAFMHRLTDRLDCNSGFMLVTDLVERENTRMLYCHNLSFDYRKVYESRLNILDSFNHFVSRTPGRVFCNQNPAACNREDIERNLLHNENLKFRFGVALPCDHRHALSLHFNRGAAFDRQEQKAGSRLLKDILPLLKDAIRAEKSLKISNQLLHHLGTRFDAFIILDRNFEVLFADPVYEGVITGMAGIRLDGGRFGLTDPEIEHRLSELASKRKQGAIDNAAGKLRLTLIPIESLENLYHWECHKDGFVLVFTREEGENPAISRLTDIYALSRCEALCALHFLQTPSIPDVADSTCRSQETVRNHLKRTMQKMGVHNQAALMKKLVALHSL